MFIPGSKHKITFLVHCFPLIMEKVRWNHNKPSGFIVNSALLCTVNKNQARTQAGCSVRTFAHDSVPHWSNATWGLVCLKSGGSVALKPMQSNHSYCCSHEDLARNRNANPRSLWTTDEELTLLYRNRCHGPSTADRWNYRRKRTKLSAVERSEPPRERRESTCAPVGCSGSASSESVSSSDSPPQSRAGEGLAPQGLIEPAVTGRNRSGIGSKRCCWLGIGGPADFSAQRASSQHGSEGPARVWTGPAECWEGRTRQLDSPGKWLWETEWVWPSLSPLTLFLI